MKKNKALPLLVVISLTLAASILPLHAQGTAFTYQGQLKEGASPANGSYDLQFSLYDDLTKGYGQVAHVLRKLRKDLEDAADDQVVEKIVLESEGIITQEQAIWTLKRT